ncbi:hypothetical protein [Kribbella sp. C-35]|uniref:hypothetical protein n=1 Tax=Kribbella sp. C-35 TaxID=2789276 RepID=UPI003978D968
MSRKPLCSAAETDRVQCGSSGQRQRRRVLDVDLVGQFGQSRGRHRGEFGPAAVLCQSYDSCAGAGSSSIGGWFDHYAGDVLAWSPALGSGGQECQLTAVDGERPYGDQCLARGREGVRGGPHDKTFSIKSGRIPSEENSSAC